MTTTQKYVSSTVLTISVLFGAFTCSYQTNKTVETTPVEFQGIGWAGPEAAEAAYQEMAPGLPVFEIAGDTPDDPTKRVVLSELAKQNNGGQHIPTIAQVIGDCVGASNTHAVEYLVAQKGPFVPIFTPYHYACMRNAPECGNGRFGKNPNGGVGAYAARAFQIYGAYPLNDNCPPYTVATESQWALKMPSHEFVVVGKTHPVRTIARIANSDDMRRTVQNYYPGTHCSDWGGHTGQLPTYKGMLLNSRGPKPWQHSMVCIGYQMLDGEQFFLVLNSWGANAFGQPSDGTPPGSFWIAKKDMDYITKSGDCWALSDAEGFPEQDLLRIFGAQKP